jgi:hypothetical protein
MSEKYVWSDAEEAKLLKLISDNVSMDKITKKIKIKEKDIKHKLKKIAVKMCNDKKTTLEIKNTLKFLSDEQLLKICNHVNKKNISSKKNITNGKKSSDLSEFGIRKVKSKMPKKDSLDYSNKIILMLTDINKKLDFIISSGNQNINLKNISSKNRNLSNVLDNSANSGSSDNSGNSGNSVSSNNSDNSATDTNTNTNTNQKQKPKQNQKQNPKSSTKQNNNITTNNINNRQPQNTTQKDKKTKSESTDSYTSGEDTDNIINMINKNRFGI